MSRVWRAWTEPERLKRWFTPAPWTTTECEIDLRPGGAYRIHMRAPDGTEHRVSGEYRVVDPPRKIVYPWGWDGDHPVKDSLGTIEFHERGAATEVVLTHSGITHELERANHGKGWTAILDKLEATYSGETP